MSGEKYARARLTEEARRLVEAEAERAEQNAKALAAAASTEAQAHKLSDEAAKRLQAGGASEGFVKRLERFREGTAKFSELRKRVRACLDEIVKLRQDPNPQQAAQKASRLGAQLTSLTAEMEPLRRELEDSFDEIEDGLALEDRREEYRGRESDLRARRELEGLRAELDERLHPGLDCSLGPVSDRAAALRARLDGLLGGNGPLTGVEVAPCREELGQLTGEAAEMHRQNRERWAVVVRWDAAFQKAGFALQLRSEGASIADPVTTRHGANTKRIRATVDSAVNLNGGISIYMRGPSGDGKVLMGPAEHCPGAIEDVVRSAADLGLIVEEVLQKNPNGGWTAVLSGLAPPAGGRTQKKKQESRCREAKPL